MLTLWRKKPRPFTDFVWQAKLDKKKVLILGDTYISDKYCKKFIEAIADVERQKIKDLLMSANYVTILSDGSTDTAVIEEEIVYIRFAVKGEIHVYFIGLI